MMTIAKSDRASRLKLLLSVLLFAALLLYAAALYRHIGYPLMWADESMTAVGAQRVLQFGYPKVHDGRNVFYDLRHSDLTLGIEPRTDAYIGGAGWLQYYFAAPFVALTADDEDLYHKTALLRIPFATVGFAGLLILLGMAWRVFPDRVDRRLAATTFVLLLIPSIPLMLHLREVRYYPLQLFLSSVALATLFAGLKENGWRSRGSVVLIALLVPLLFLSFAPAALAFCLTAGIFLAGKWVAEYLRGSQGALQGHYIPPLLGLFAGGLLLVPLVMFFRSFSISRQLASFYGFSLAGYLENLAVIGGYFSRYDILLFAVMIKLVLLFLWYRHGSVETLSPALRLSALLTLYLVVHALCVANIPNRLFTRYFITLQPMLALGFALDLVLLWRLSPRLPARLRASVRSFAALFLLGSLLWSYGRNQPFMAGRLAEMRTPYRGVLDYVIPYLAEQFHDTSRLVIATNYEEMSYVYYLGSRTIVGFLNPDLDDQMRGGLLPQPDVVHFRRFWATTRTEEIFNRLLAAGDYVAIPFPVFDYGFNNIPEVVHWTPETGWEWGLHLFTTALTDDPQMQTTLFVRRVDLPGVEPQ